ncbi:PEP-CTERM protein-sorting domain-containing protein [Nitrosospira briensis]|uniref:PEP-CTERM protein-sorting domain-containing protein n=1 Tax=Nitrosospira briensis TaxID=35799 RepID=A0A1I5BKG5_9PROT|nr:choice-of-anchor K domain-containing protein [Nitrosospira briensis]SFN74981.1 PEP-CTERM protein-sorting domain-containing protein [Nitrosospira briensis]
MNHKFTKLQRHPLWLGLTLLAALAPAYTQAADAGTSTGTFLDPTPSCPPATCSGIGTNSFSWGEAESSGDTVGSLSFAGSSFAPGSGETFKLGTLTYHNGTTRLGTEVSSVGIDIALNFNDVPENNFTYHERLSINTTPNSTGDPVADADFVWFTTGNFPYTFNVAEEATASVDIMAKLAPAGDQLQLISLTNPTEGGSVGVIPEPETYALFLAGLGLMGAVISRRNKKA